jgi:hypothetical protein
MVLLTSLMYFLRIAWFKHGWAFGIVHSLIPALAMGPSTDHELSART